MNSTRLVRTWALPLAMAFVVSCQAHSDPNDEPTDALTSAVAEPRSDGTFPARWEDGTTCGSTPVVESWKYTDSTIIFRQSICTNFEAPFLYLLLGETKALLLDTGTGHADVRGPVDAAIDEWTKARGLASLELIVAHTHAHGDHVRGDDQFRPRPNTTLVRLPQRSVATFFGLSSWPEGSATFDLGGRVLDVVPLPGHESSSIAVYDREQQLLFTGDSLYPGRLYIQSFSEYQASIRRLVDFVDGSSLPVRWVLGAHIEMSKTPGHGYPFRARKHLDEHEMEQPLERLRELDRALQAMGSTPRRETHPHFIVYP